jgi:hypothetical protein
MITRLARCATVVLALACLFATGCRDRHEPVKPTVASASATQ